MGPALHHARVCTIWLLRRPLLLLVGLFLLGGVASLAALEDSLRLAEGRAGIARGIRGLGLVLCGLVLGAMTEPGRGGAISTAERMALPQLPLSPILRRAARLCSTSLVLAALLTAVLAALLTAVLAPLLLLPLNPAGLLGFLAALPATLLPALPVTLFLAAPALAAGVSTRMVGRPGAMITLAVTALPVAIAVLLAARSPVLGALAGLVGGVLMLHATPKLEAALDGFDPRWLGLSLAGGVRVPWHLRPGRIAFVSARRAAAVSLLAMTPVLPRWILSPDVFPANALLGLAAVGVLTVLVLGLWMTPLGLDGRTVSSEGRSKPFDGQLARAFAALPVAPVTLRRVALRQSGLGVLGGMALMAVVSVFFAYMADQKPAEPWTMLLWGLPALAMVPTSPALNLGNALERRTAGGITLLLAGALYLAVPGTELLGESPVLTALVALLPTVALGLGAALTLRLWRYPTASSAASSHSS